MICKILCPKCAGTWLPPSPEDVSAGWRQRMVEIPRAGKPPEQSYLVCDGCNLAINDGDLAIAVTLWRGKEPHNWESEYSQNENGNN